MLRTLIPRAVLACWALAMLLGPSARANELSHSMALNFDALADQHLSVTDKTGLQGNANYTLEAWVYPTSYTDFPTIFGNDFNASFWLGLTTTGRVRFYPRGGSSFDSPAVIPLNSWTHIAATYNSATGSKIYVNGSLNATNASILGAPGVTSTDLRIGADRSGAVPFYFWRGALREVRIWSVERTAGQILDHLYVQPPLPPHSAGLQAAWRGRVSLVGGAHVIDEVSAAAGFTEHSAALVNVLPTSFQRMLGYPQHTNTGMAFDGSTSYAQLSPPPCCPMDNGSITIMGWIAPNSVSTFQTIVGRDYATSFWFGTSPTGRLRFYASGLAGGIVDTPANVISAGRWQHVAVTYDQTTTRFYVNGRLVHSTGALTGAIPVTADPVRVGANGSAVPSFYFQGRMDDMLIVNGAVSASTIVDRVTYTGTTTRLSIPDAGGTPRTAYLICGPAGDYYVTSTWHGTARSVPAGTSSSNFARTSVPIHGFMNDFMLAEGRTHGGITATETDSLLSTVASTLTTTYDKVITGMRVFVFAPVENLQTLDLELKSPAGTAVALITTGEARGRNLHCLFADDALVSLAGSAGPYDVEPAISSLADGTIKPSQPLSAFNGESTAGTWFLTGASSNLDDKLGLWAWGIQWNDLTVGVEGSGPAGGVALANTGANPARGGGSFAFTLPAEAQARLELIDILGRRVAVLYDARTPAGHTSVQWRARELGAGVYFARLSVDGRSAASATVVVAK